MNRIELINKIIKENNFTNYLEIGVYNGHCFLNVECKRKIAVDPIFRIDWNIRKDNLLKKINKKIFNRYSNYYSLKSDDFFEQNETFLKKFKPQVIFIDGLHTYKQSYNDVINSLKYLSNDGFIIMHDCNPLNATQGLPANSYEEVCEKIDDPNWDHTWTGDVWKTIVRLRSERKDLNVKVLDSDHGLGIIKFGKADNNLDFSIKEIEKFDYNNLENNRLKFLNLVANY
jgi:hypothetical protein